MINKMVNKHTVDYHAIPSQSISRINYIPPWLRKSFKCIVLRLLTNTFGSQNIYMKGEGTLT